jgi:hypothetical protein
MSSKIKPKGRPQFITKDNYDSIDECNCGGPVFKFHNTSKNVFVAHCGLFKRIIEFDKKTKKMILVPSKKPACNWEVIYNGERPVFAEINNKLTKSVEENNKSPDIQLEEKLKLLFKFLRVSNHTSTLDEINNLVRFSLFREPRKSYYFPSTTAFMRLSHRESFDDYEKRIFSVKIIDRSYKPVKLIPLPETSQFIDTGSDNEEQDDTESENGTSDEEGDSEESDNESNYSNSENEDISENGDDESIIEDFAEEHFDDYDDYDGEQDYDD